MSNFTKKIVDYAHQKLQSGLGFIYQQFKKSTATMLVVTGVIGYILSSAAQIFGIATNSKLSSEQKGYLVPQEFYEALINIFTFAFVALGTKKLISKMASTGKIAPQDVKNFLLNHKAYKNQIGKLSLDLDIALKNKPELLNSYYAYKNLTTTVGTIGAGALASGVVTPIIRNSCAVKAQQRYLDNNSKFTTITDRYSGDMKI